MLRWNWKISTVTWATLMLGLFGLWGLSNVVCWAQSSASLLVTADTNCNWKNSMVFLRDDSTSMTQRSQKTTAGEHLLQATSADGNPHGIDCSLRILGPNFRGQALPCTRLHSPKRGPHNE
jgi:hypothetical protein